MMTSRFGLQCSDSEHSAIILCMHAGATMCSDDYKLHTSPHTHVQIDEHDDLESNNVIMFMDRLTMIHEL